MRTYRVGDVINNKQIVELKSKCKNGRCRQYAYFKCLLCERLGSSLCYQMSQGARCKGCNSISHGLSKTHPLYRKWGDINSRCYNSKTPAYANYGARGITFQWSEDPMGFVRYVESNLGECPQGYTLDRIDNDGNYCEGNLQWADRKQQSRNRRNVRTVEFEGEIVPLYELAERFNIRLATLRQRLDRDGLSIREAVERN